MKIESIKSFKFNTLNTNNKQVENHTPKVVQPCFQKYDAPIYFCGIDKTYENSHFKEDTKYRKELLKAIDKPSFNDNRISSIIGAQEILSIMKVFNNDEENFVSSKENIDSGKFAANLHIHTVASDGSFTPEKLLDQAANYGNERFKKTGKPFVLAITDHDRTDSAKAAINIIYNNPDKYKHVKLILGAELTTFTDVPTEDGKTKPQMLHTLAYGINPENKMFKAFIEKKQNEKRMVAKEMTDAINSVYKKTYKTNKNLYETDKMKDFYPPVNKGIVGIFNYVNSYSMANFYLKEGLMKNPEFTEKIEKENPDKSADIELEKIKAFYTPKTFNNKAISAKKLLAGYYAEKFNMTPEDFQEFAENSLDEKGKRFTENAKTELKKFAVGKFEKYNYCASIDEVGKVVKSQPQIIIGLAHPLDYIKKDPTDNIKFDRLNHIYKNFKNSIGDNFKFSEVYYQSYGPELKEFANNSKDFLKEKSSEYGTFSTGSQDSHRNSIFQRY